MEAHPACQWQSEEGKVFSVTLKKNHHLCSDLEFLIWNTKRPGHMLCETSDWSSQSQRRNEPSYLCLDMSDDVGDLMGTFSPASGGFSIKDCPTLEQSGVMLNGLQVTISGSHCGPERLVLKSWIFCRPCWLAKNLPFISSLSVSLVSFTCTAEVWFPQAAPATAVTENHIFNGISRLEETTIYGLRSGRRLTFYVQKSGLKKATKCFSALFHKLSLIYPYCSLLCIHSIAYKVIALLICFLKSYLLFRQWLSRNCWLAGELCHF